MKCLICNKVINSGDIIISGTELKFVGPNDLDCDFDYSDNFVIHKNCLFFIGNQEVIEVTNERSKESDIQRSNALTLFK